MHRIVECELSVVVPAFNEEDVLVEFHRRLSAVLDHIEANSEILYVNDGSRDNTLAILRSLQNEDSRVSVVDLSRNFGKEVALTAGLEFAQGSGAIVVIDADLQDPPEVIADLVEQWRAGYDNVYARRIERLGESFLKKASAHVFYRIIQRVSRVKIPPDTGDFRLLSRRAVDALLKLPERHRFMKGLFAWIGYSSIAVPYRRDPRFAGVTKWNYWKLWNFAIDGLTSFTTAPLKIATYVGVLTAIAAFGYGSFVIYKTLAYGDPVRGYPSLMVVILFIGGIQLMGLGIIGEYLGRMFDETKQRPLFLLNSYAPARQHIRQDTANP